MATPAPVAGRRRRRRRRLTIRARLTLSYAALTTGCGAVLITIVYLYMRYVPNYQIIETQALGPDDAEPSGISGSTGLTPVSPSGPTDYGVSIQIRTVADFLDTLLVASVVALVLLAVVGGAVGWVVAGRIIRPLAVINAAAARASAGTLDHRIDLEGPDDEIRGLADTFDRMLASLDRSFTAHRRFAANASHELRTPLATTKTMIDVTLADPDAERAELRQLAERIGEVNQASIETIDALLDLADADSSTPTRELVDLADLVESVVAEFFDEAAAADVELTAEYAPCTVRGDAVLLRQAATNLVRNSIRHNLPAGHAAVRVLAHGARARVAVTNSGPRVAAAAVESLTEPFVRGAGRSTTRGSGHGLGLAIVAAVATAHHGTLALHPRPEGGLRVHLDLPAASSLSPIPG
ncbi:sensor histidine kinase [Promicromonospora sp. CA-289599]|uniref:sensor histidine kinase n=1 Tax=Promicromonospora sp. CA-289599 TaxID=3240014 RepID=UPI003D931497